MFRIVKNGFMFLATIAKFFRGIYDALYGWFGSLLVPMLVVFLVVVCCLCLCCCGSLALMTVKSCFETTKMVYNGSYERKLPRYEQ